MAEIISIERARELYLQADNAYQDRKMIRFTVPGHQGYYFVSEDDCKHYVSLTYDGEYNQDKIIIKNGVEMKTPKQIR